jgi:hypothetical protein
MMAATIMAFHGASTSANNWPCVNDVIPARRLTAFMLRAIYIRASARFWSQSLHQNHDREFSHSGSVRMMPGHRRCRLFSTFVAVQTIIGGDLVGTQHTAHGEVIFKMGVAKLALQPADLSQDTT